MDYEQINISSDEFNSDDETDNEKLPCTKVKWIILVKIITPFCHGLAVRVFANGPGDLGSIPGRVIPKTQKMVLDASLLNTQHYKVRIKGKVEQSREGVAPSPTPWCSSYRKGNLRVTLDYGRQLYFFTYIFFKKNYPRKFVSNLNNWHSTMEFSCCGGWLWH